MRKKRSTITAVMILGLIGLAAVCITVFVVSQGSWDDDAFISFRYAHNLYNGNGLVYNAGDRVEGYTNFLWTLVAYVGMLLHVAPLTFAQAVSVASQVVTLYLVFLLGKVPGRSPFLALIAPALLACRPSFLVYPMTGMETTFFSMLIVLALLLVQRTRTDGMTGAILTGIALVAVTLTRFDGFVIVFVIVGYKLLVDREFKTMLPVVIVLAVAMSTYHLWRIVYYPTLLPNTFYAKVGFSLGQIADGIRYVLNFVVGGGQLAIVLATLPFVVGKATRTMRLIAVVLVLHVAYVVAVGGDWMPHYRFLLPVLPLLFLLMQEGVVSVYELARPAIHESRVRRLLSAMVLALLIGLHLVPLYRGRRFQVFSAPWFDSHEAQILGKHLSRALSPDALVAIEWGGILPFYLRQPVIDTFGLTDRDIVRRDFPRSVFGRWITTEYLASRRPDVIIPCARLFKSRELAELSVAHTPVESINRARSIYNYGFYLSLASDANGYRVCILHVDERGYWPILVRTGFKNFSEES